MSKCILNSSNIMSFGSALTLFLFLVKGETVTEVINDCYGDPNRYDISHTCYEKGEPSMPVVDAIYMKTADNKLVPWLASQTDVLAEDWQIVD